MCAPKFTCILDNDDVLNRCIPACDPLVQDCPDDQHCVAFEHGTHCVLDRGREGEVHDPCEYINGCHPGVACVDPSAAVECDPNAGGCCEPYCDLNLPNTCTGQWQICKPVYPPGQAPAEQGDLGYCSVPG